MERICSSRSGPYVKQLSDPEKQTGIHANNKTLFSEKRQGLLIRAGHLLGVIQYFRCNMTFFYT